jgi:hypothetical protein
MKDEACRPLQALIGPSIRCQRASLATCQRRPHLHELDCNAQYTVNLPSIATRYCRHGVYIPSPAAPSQSLVVLSVDKQDVA